MSGYRPGAAVTAEQAALVLTDAASVLRALDSDEGYVRYWRPEITIYDREYDAMPEEQQAWYEPHDNGDNVWYPDEQGGERKARGYRLRDDVDLRDVFLVEAFYRIGNSMGQGGARIINASANPFAE